MIDSMLDGSMRPVIHTGKMPWITLRHLGPIETERPAPAPVEAWEAREAARLMSLTNLFGAAAPIARETDDRIMLSAVDSLVQQMIGWRELDEVAPGLPVLVIPPRLFPEGWYEDAGVIQKKTKIAFDDFWPSHHFAFYENIGRPRWIEEERERMSRTAFSDEYFCEPMSCPDGHRRSGKIQ